MFIRRTACLPLLCALSAAFGQAGEKQPADFALDKLVLQVKGQPDVAIKVSIVTNAGNFAVYIATLKPDAKLGMTPAFHAYEEQRIDKQVSEPASAGGTGSAVSKGSLPWLFGFALEHGAVTQSVESNNIVFRGNIANVASSFSVAFRSGQGSPTTNTLAGYSFHYDIYNHRDPRDERWDSLWTLARGKMGVSVPNASGALRDVLTTDFPAEFKNWQQRAETTIRGLPATASDGDIRTAVKSIADDLLRIVSNSTNALAVVEGVATAIAKQEAIKNDVISAINHSPDREL